MAIERQWHGAQNVLILRVEVANRIIAIELLQVHFDNVSHTG
eukprot:CAMPEP_0178466550 /NCGR_PEP_ID=MMETSP0689_2-20121128/51963_1 /TAXON_ID=160604 /ORGANISM="Amphidinium massartii, Strain CS-259" /LENGTH=41 /DNA_ID= /DNA_START= /DNA_END= /DNA_ORIENTATION=